MSKEENDKINFQLDEVISPIFGDDYKNRIINYKNNSHKKHHKKLNYLEQHIENELSQKEKLAKINQYETKVEFDSNILEEYQKNKSQQQVINTLPSNYLDFRDNLTDNNKGLTMINDLSSDSTISQIINDILDKKQED